MTTTDAPVTSDRERLPLVGRRLPAALGPVLLLLVLVIIDISLQPALLDVAQIGFTIQVALTVVLIAAAQTMAVLVRGLDLSVGGAFAIGNVLTATWLGGFEGGSSWRLILILLIGAAAGGLNGVLVAVLNLQPVVATLGTLALYGGIALLILPTAGGEVPFSVSDLFTGSIGQVPYAYFWLLLLIVLWLVLRSSRLGLHLYAVGSDEARATLNGVPVRRTKIAAYTVGGLLATCAGIYLAMVTSGGDPTAGQAYLLPSIVAVVVGGTSLRGGSGGIGLTVIGAFTVVVLGDVITAQSLSVSFSIIASSVLLLLAVGIRQIATVLKGRAR